MTAREATEPVLRTIVAALLPFAKREVISGPMKNTGATISEQIMRGRIALHERSRALASLLLLGLTRGCRVH